MMQQPNRLDHGGRVNRARPLTFTFNGIRYQGFEGDSLASALLANNVHLVGRSFKYHRPRGIVGAGAEEPSGLVQLGVGDRTEPNSRVTQIELFEGLQARSQNCWPGVTFDLGAVAGLAAPLLRAGFYYKTFKWPPALWHVLYERLIRKAAGMGRAPQEADPDRYEHRFAHADILVIGSGPAGLMAALAGARAGARVILADEQPLLGGSLLDDPPGETIDLWREEVLCELASTAKVRLLPRTTVFAYYDHNYVAAAERVSDHFGLDVPAFLPRQRLWKIRAKQVVLATGAIERPMVFGGNDRPGIMLAGAVRSYINRYGVLPGRNAVVATSHDGGYAAALALHHANARVVVVDLRENVAGPLSDRAAAAGIRRLSGHGIIRSFGMQRVRAVEIAELNRQGDAIVGLPQRLECDLLAVAGGWNPAIHLHAQSRGRPRFDPERSFYLPGEPIQAERSAGACAGVFDLRGCLTAGAKAGAGAARDAGLAASEPDLPGFAVPSSASLTEPRVIWLLPASRATPKPKRFVDLQNDVTADDLQLALQEGYESIEHLKRYTTTGMGTDQGKTANVLALGIVSELTGRPMAELGVTTFRPPYTPVTFGTIVGRHRGALFDPLRVTPMHPWHEQNDAVFETVGQWQRPWYYLQAGESMDQAVQREVAAVRSGIGMLDASTLGKIDLQGRDAAILLDRLYTNRWSSLPVGRCRYGLMLKDDGMVFDDGVTTRLGEQHYLMSTTSGNAAAVLAWIEEWLQTEWPELQVYATSVTEQWATVSLSGPKSRLLVQRLFPDLDLSPDRFAHMSAIETSLEDIPARLFRISFTGELGFEIQVPSRYGLALWERCMELGEDCGGVTPYGTEAMHVLRAEKGYIIVGQEADGTVTPGDLGQERLVRHDKGDFIGKRALARRDLTRSDRLQLVGLLPKDQAVLLDEGAQIVLDPHGQAPVTSIGHVTSSYLSPTIERPFALALIAGGPQLVGQTVFVPQPNGMIAAEVTEPVFVDREGARLRG